MTGFNQRLSVFTKFLCLATLFLIFAGGLVTSTGSGLAVPDWPLSYGTLFPPMVGGIFYEHGHRMIASVVGLLTLILAVWLWRTRQEPWVKKLGGIALAAVIAQGVLGGVGVLLFLPTVISVSHAVLAQTFFILVIVLAYSQSKEKHDRHDYGDGGDDPLFLKLSMALTVLIFVQLVLGALMRHTGAGLAVPDFPTMSGKWLPLFSDQDVARINDWRFEMNLDPITMRQIWIHVLHRIGAVMIAAAVGVLTWRAFQSDAVSPKIKTNVLIFDGIILAQILLGAFTVWSVKEPHLASFHVMTGALLLGLSVLLTLRISPLKWRRFKEMVVS